MWLVSHTVILRLICFRDCSEQCQIIDVWRNELITSHAEPECHLLVTVALLQLLHLVWFAAYCFWSSSTTLRLCLLSLLSGLCKSCWLYVWHTMGHFIFRGGDQSVKLLVWDLICRTSSHFRPIVASHWQTQKKVFLIFSDFIDWLIITRCRPLFLCFQSVCRLLYIPKLWRRLWRICFVYICDSWSDVVWYFVLRPKFIITSCFAY